MPEVRLEPISSNNVKAFFDLKVAPGQERFVAVLDEVRSRGGTELSTSWVPGDDGPERFYLDLGFVPTGEIDDGEVVAKRPLGSAG